MKLTKKLIDAAHYEGGTYANGTQQRQMLWDDEVPGFGCRILPSGKKAFILNYRTAGRKRMLTIGAYGVLTLDEARKQARAHLASLETIGTDPLAERERLAQGETIADLITAYLERHAPRKKTGDADRKRLEHHILPKWGTRKASSITRAEVATLHARIGKTAPYEANRVLSLLSKLFGLARRWAFVPDDFPNPARDIDRFQEIKRDRWISAQELPHLAKAINEENNEVARHALWLYLLTGTRKTELLTARWDQVDWDRAELKLPDTKAGRVHYVPLSAAALTLLRNIPRQADNPYILPGRGRRGTSPEDKARHPTHLVNISKAWARVKTQATLARWREEPRAAELIERLTQERAAARHPNAPKMFDTTPSLPAIRAAADFPLPPAIDDVRLHDLRRTVGSWLAQAGNSLHLIGRVLNHTNASTTQVYARFGEDSVRNALEQHAARLMSAAGLVPPGEVIPFGSTGQGANAATPDPAAAELAKVIDLTSARQARA